MSFLRRVDDKILSFFTKFSHKFQRLTGRTNYFLANIFLTLMAMSILLLIANYWFSIIIHKSNFLDLLAASVFIYYISIDKNNLKKAEEIMINDTCAKIIFKFPSDYLIRIIFSCLAILSLRDFALIATGVTIAKTSEVFEILYNSFAIDITCYVYLIAITPLPPGKSKIKEWIESFGKSPALIPVKNR